MGARAVRCPTARAEARSRARVGVPPEVASVRAEARTDRDRVLVRPRRVCGRAHDQARQEAPPPRSERIPRFHRVTDWATRDEPQVARALDDCEILAARTEEILRGPSELIAIRRITAVASHLLGYVDRSWGRESPPPTGQPDARLGSSGGLQEVRRDAAAASSSTRSSASTTGPATARRRSSSSGGWSRDWSCSRWSRPRSGIIWRVDETRWRAGSLGRAAALGDLRDGRGARRLSERAVAHGSSHGKFHPRLRSRADERALARPVPAARRWHLRRRDVPPARERDPPDATRRDRNGTTPTTASSRSSPASSSALRSSPPGKCRPWGKRARQRRPTRPRPQPAPARLRAGRRSRRRVAWEPSPLREGSRFVASLGPRARRGAVQAY